jgi:hypothetical protein
MLIFFFYCLLIICVILIKGQDDFEARVDFHVVIKAKQKTCFGEDIAAGTLFSVIAAAEDPTYTEMEFQLIDPEKRKIHTGINSPQWKLLYTAEFSGAFQICMTNKGEKDMKILFQLLQDYDLAYVKSLGGSSVMPLWTDVISITLKAEHIKTLAHTLTKLEESNVAKSDTIFNTIVFFSGLFVIISALVTWYSVRYLKGFFMKKKLI